jgi:ParB/RepB/Spo0J family partition protein
MTPTAEFVRALPLDKLLPSPFNPRQSMDEAELQGLAASLSADGLLEPIVVRPATGDDERYEIIAGHRRVEAARLAGLDALDAIVRVMTDAEVKVAHLVENLQRENLRALEEAEGYRRLRDDEGLTGDQIAARVGKKRGVVFNRLKLLDLCDDARTALADGRIGAEVAVLIARIGPAKLQAKALAIALDTDWRGDRKSFRAIRDDLLDKFALNLTEALFDRDDADLLPAAGACTTCPKRSGAGDPDLLGDIIDRKQAYRDVCGEHVCLDPDCFAAKKAAHLAREAAKLVEQGKQVVTGAAAKKALSFSRWDKKVELKGTDYLPVAEGKALLKQAGAGKDAPKPVVLQDATTGKTVQAFSRADLEAAGVKLAKADKKRASEQESWAAQRARDEADRKRREAAAAAVTERRIALFDQVREKMDLVERNAFDLRVLAHVALDGIEYRDAEFVLQRWAAKTKEALAKRIGAMPVAEVTRLLMDLALAPGVVADRYGGERQPEALFAAAKHYGVDLGDLAPKQKPKAEKKGKGKKAPAPEGAAKEEAQP